MVRRWVCTYARTIAHPLILLRHPPLAVGDTITDIDKQESALLGSLPAHPSLRFVLTFCCNRAFSSRDFAKLAALQDSSRLTSGHRCTCVRMHSGYVVQGITPVDRLLFPQAGVELPLLLVALAPELGVCVALVALLQSLYLLPSRPKNTCYRIKTWFDAGQSADKEVLTFLQIGCLLIWRGGCI